MKHYKTLEGRARASQLYRWGMIFSENRLESRG
jgi:hypothetical protein